MTNEPSFLEVAVTRRDHPDLIRWGPFCSLSECERLMVNLGGNPDVLQARIVNMHTKQPPSVSELQSMFAKPQKCKFCDGPATISFRPGGADPPEYFCSRCVTVTFPPVERDPEMELR